MKRGAQFQLLDCQKGAILPWVALLLPLIFFAVAFVVDHSTESLSVATIQNTADISALSAVRRFDSTIEGWRDAKKAAISSLKNNSIHGELSSVISGIKFTDGPRNRYDEAGVDGARLGTTGTAGDVTVTIERGIVLYRNQEDGHQFISLEPSLDDDENGPWNSDLPPFLYANAVRTTILFDSLDTSFGKLTGVDSVDDLERVGLALVDENLDMPVAPFAIPLCQLLLDTDVNNPPYNPDMHIAQHMRSDFIPGNQSARELVFTELNANGSPQGFNGKLMLTLTDEEERRREGITRYESHVRPPFVTWSYGPAGGQCSTNPFEGENLSCKHLTMFGVMGAPSKIAGQSVKPSDMPALLNRANEGRLVASPGMYFSPLDSLVERGNTLEHYAGAQARSFLNSRTAGTIDTIFMEGPEATRETTVNFPHVRKPLQKCSATFWDMENRPCASEANGREIDDPLRKTWPMEVNGSTTTHVLLMDPTRELGDFTNPLCHTGEANVDQPKEVPVRRGLAMVIAPSEN